MTEKINAALTILRRKQLEIRTGLGRSTIYAKLDKKSSSYDPSFPRQVALSNNAGAVGWIESEVEAWIQTRVQVSRGVNEGAK